MPNCRTCGQEISEQQYNNFNGKCPECVRMQPIRNAASSYSTESCCACIGLIILLILIIISFITGFDILTWIVYGGNPPD